MKKLFKQNPFDRAATVIHNINLNISVRTVRRHLNAAHIHSHPAANILLKPEHQCRGCNLKESIWIRLKWNAVV